MFVEVRGPCRLCARARDRVDQGDGHSTTASLLQIPTEEQHSIGGGGALQTRIVLTLVHGVVQGLQSGLSQGVCRQGGGHQVTLVVELAIVVVVRVLEVIPSLPVVRGQGHTHARVLRVHVPAHAAAHAPVLDHTLHTQNIHEAEVVHTARVSGVIAGMTFEIVDRVLHDLVSRRWMSLFFECYL